MPSGRHSTVAVPPVNRTVDRSTARPVGSAEPEREGEGERVGEGERDGEGGRLGEGEADGESGVSARARRTAPSSRGLLWAAPPESALANCQAPSAPAAVPTATHAAVPAALHHLPTRTLSPGVP
ncbi:hypothetical protein GCM10010349_49470 [Streptomyces flavofungini]|nr:hypothetical protein GCM10010349_49470 [Streptomyces flavofungini]